MHRHPSTTSEDINSDEPSRRASTCAIDSWSWLRKSEGRFKDMQRTKLRKLCSFSKANCFPADRCYVAPSQPACLTGGASCVYALVSSASLPWYGPFRLHIPPCLPLMGWRNRSSRLVAWTRRRAPAEELFYIFPHGQEAGKDQ